MVWQREVMGLKLEDVAKNLGVDTSTVSRIMKLFRETGLVTKQPYPEGRAFHKLTDVIKLYILQLVLDNPGIYLRELQAQVSQVTGLEISLGTLCNFLHQQNFTRQKMKLRATQIDEALRAQFSADVSLYKAEMLVFLDETGTDRRDVLRHKGYSLRGKPAVAHKLLVRGERISVIAFMSPQGILDSVPVKGGVNADKFYHAVQRSLLPHLMPFNGTNPHSVLILDNCYIHHVEEVVKMVQELGVIVHFLPPYSPDFNPIEMDFSKAKTLLKSLEAEMQTDDIETLILGAFSQISDQDCCAWMEECGVYSM